MRTEANEIMDHYITESQFLWNSSGLNDTIVECGVNALGRCREDLDLEDCPEMMARRFGIELVMKTTKLILMMYYLENLDT